MSRSEYTLVIRYHPDPLDPRQERRIPFNWEPSKDDVVSSIRRLRDQLPGVHVVSATLVREVLVHRYNLGETLCES